MLRISEKSDHSGGFIRLHVCYGPAPLLNTNYYQREFYSRSVISQRPSKDNNAGLRPFDDRNFTIMPEYLGARMRAIPL